MTVNSFDGEVVFEGILKSWLCQEKREKLELKDTNVTGSSIEGFRRAAYMRETVLKHNERLRHNSDEIMPPPRQQCSVMPFPVLIL